MLHLHGLHDNERAALLDFLASLSEHLDDLAGHGRNERTLARVVHLRRVVGQHVKRQLESLFRGGTRLIFFRAQHDGGAVLVASDESGQTVCGAVVCAGDLEVGIVLLASVVDLDRKGAVGERESGHCDLVRCVLALQKVEGRPARNVEALVGESGPGRVGVGSRSGLGGALTE
eukprot:TRINITY_DN2888_c0_g1_i1.p2 TRINITY_DN2888_c0_g1~~TRINITY_DN2888_c0_g1_i1.p2  ORF type:complete len:174 (+),score=33.67 TRINITY_DN2888_c0_g1_i1:136-657(+)